MFINYFYKNGILKNSNDNDATYPLLTSLVSLLLQKSAHLYGKRVDSLYEMVYNTLSKLTLQNYGQSLQEKRLASSKKAGNQRTMKRIGNTLPETEFVSIDDILNQEAPEGKLNLDENEYNRHAMIQSEKNQRQLEVAFSTFIGRSFWNKNEENKNDEMEDIEEYQDNRSEHEDTPQFLPHLFQLIQGITDDETGLVKLNSDDVETLKIIVNDDAPIHLTGLQMAEESRSNNTQQHLTHDISFTMDDHHNTSFASFGDTSRLNTSFMSNSGQDIQSPQKQSQLKDELNLQNEQNETPNLPDIQSPNNSFRDINSSFSNQNQNQNQEMENIQNISLVQQNHDTTLNASLQENLQTPQKLNSSHIVTPPPIQLSNLDSVSEDENEENEDEHLKYLWVPLDPHSQSSTFKSIPYKQKDKYRIPPIPKQKAYLNLSLVSDRTLNTVNINDMDLIFPISFSKFDTPVSFQGLYHSKEFEYMMEQEKKREKAEKIQKQVQIQKQNREYQYSALPDEDLDEEPTGENEDAWPLGRNTSRLSSKSIDIANTSTSLNQEKFTTALDPVFDLPPTIEEYDPPNDEGEYFFQDWKQQYSSTEVVDVNDMDKWDSNYEELCKEHVQQYLSHSYQYMQTGDIVNRVRDWESNVKPLLKEQNARPEYDIKKCSRQVVKLLKNQTKEQGRSNFLFSEVCKGKEPYEVCRMFLATLQLASSNQIELNIEKNRTFIEDDFTTDDEFLYLKLKA